MSPDESPAKQDGSGKQASGGVEPAKPADLGAPATGREHLAEEPEVIGFEVTYANGKSQPSDAPLSDLSLPSDFDNSASFSRDAAPRQESRPPQAPQRSPATSSGGTPAPGSADNMEGGVGTTNSTANTPGAPAAPHVRLSTALALAQTLPSGTAMGFSVEYTFLAGYVPNGRYVWIIQPPSGPAVALPVQLSRRGALTQFVPQWGPVPGTYQLQLAIVDSNDRPQAMCRPIDAVYAR
ncbi:MAG: hypothetical protein KDB14_06725 [Planctomycetales bacterium]|nr:hypothetical protein [Planctomycetales bacterium]